MRGDKIIDKDRKRVVTRRSRAGFSFKDLTPEEEDKVREMARNTGLTFQECAEAVVRGQKTLQEVV